MNQDKIHFLKNDFPGLLQSIRATAKGNWGLMNGQQMVEHFVDVVRLATGKLVLPLISNELELEAMRSFLNSEKPFAKNIRNPYIGDEPHPVKQPGMEAAIEKLREELDAFFDAFQKNPALKTLNPFFGELDFAGNVQLLHKHALHHLKQFGLPAQ